MEKPTWSNRWRSDKQQTSTTNFRVYLERLKYEIIFSSVWSLVWAMGKRGVWAVPLLSTHGRKCFVWWMSLVWFLRMLCFGSVHEWHGFLMGSRSWGGFGFGGFELPDSVIDHKIMYYSRSIQSMVSSLLLPWFPSLLFIITITASLDVQYNAGFPTRSTEEY